MAATPQQLAAAILRGPVQSPDQDYFYHATNLERAYEIAAAGLKRHKPHEFTDQDAWPDGSTEKRSYFTPTPQNTWQFAPEEGQAVLLRVNRKAHPFKRESTGDIYSTKDIPPHKLEIMAADNSWHPIARLLHHGSATAHTI